MVREGAVTPRHVSFRAATLAAEFLAGRAARIESAHVPATALAC
jgi:hypothetical protein